MFEDLTDLLDKENVIINIRVISRNSRKCITFLNGISKDEDLKELLKTFKKQFNCNGSIAFDENTNTPMMKMSGDQSSNLQSFFQKRNPNFKIYVLK